MNRNFLGGKRLSLGSFSNFLGGKGLLKPQIYYDLLKHYLDPEGEPSNNLLPPRRSEYTLGNRSKIINTKIISLISKHIDQMDSSDGKRLYLPYEFKLLLRGSRDGFTSEAFHSLCDDKPQTLK